jgi:hypothetical protein
MVTKSLAISFKYHWEPFVVAGSHYSIREDFSKRVTEKSSSHWGAAIYKWQGSLESGPNEGKFGVLVGETHDLRQRINNYKSGLQPAGNRYWREEFLLRGDIRLFILALDSFHYSGSVGNQSAIPLDILAGKNHRVILEELLVLEELHQDQTIKWVVNKWE